MKRSGAQGFLNQVGTPATFALLLLTVIGFLFSISAGTQISSIMFWSDWSHPWGLFTYPFANAASGFNLLWFITAAAFLYWIGSTTERDLGASRLLCLFFGMSALGAIFVWIGWQVAGYNVLLPLFGLGMPVAALTVAWGTRHPHQNVLLIGIFPTPGWILAWLAVALNLFGYASLYQSPVVGLFASLHLAVAYLLASKRIPGLTPSRSNVPAPLERSPLKATERMGDDYYDNVKKREKERAERERLKKLFEGSLDDEPK
jgi:hypothetical protein